MAMNIGDRLLVFPVQQRAVAIDTACCVSQASRAGAAPTTCDPICCAELIAMLSTCNRTANVVMRITHFLEQFLISFCSRKLLPLNCKFPRQCILVFKIAIVDQVFDRLHSEGSDGSASDLSKTMDSCLLLPRADIIHALQDKEAEGWCDFTLPPFPLPSLL